MPKVRDLGSIIKDMQSLRLQRRTLLKGAAAGAGLLLLDRLGLTTVNAVAGPSTNADPYLLPSADGVRLSAILTVGDKPAGNGYRMVGIPDGMGFFNNPDGKTFTLVLNHELTNVNGITRGNGDKGAFVSRWTIDRDTLLVIDGQDLTPAPSHVYTWDAVAKKYSEGPTMWQRLCSADLAKPAAYLNGSLGTPDRILLNGEEINGGRAWARVVNGAYAGGAWQFARMGTGSWENLLASPRPSNKTIVIGMDDGNVNTAPIAANYPCEVKVYVGAKQGDGNPIERAGLTNGKVYGVRVWRTGHLVTEESNDFGLGDTGTKWVSTALFDLVELGNRGDVTALTSLQEEEDMFARGVFRFLRTEDGAWDPRPAHSSDYYFVTTNAFTAPSRLWRLRFNDMDHPEQGGQIDIILDGTEGQHMFDNVTIDKYGRILLDEDPGNESYVSKIWLYGIDSGQLIEVARHNPKYFDPSLNAKEFMTQDEESSGVTDAAEILGDGWFLVDVQAHKVTTDVELAENGQLLAMYISPEIGMDPASAPDEDA